MFWLFTISTGILCLGWLLLRLSDRWQSLPHFVYNQVGGVTAYCSISDFRTATRKVGNFVLVPETIASAAEWRADKPFAAYLMEWDPDLCPRKHEPELFVPFASERHLSYVEQGQIFDFAPTHQMVINKWWLKKEDQNARNDLRLRLRRFVRGREDIINLAQIVAVIAMLISGSLAFMAYLDKQAEKRNAQPAVFYTTNAGSSELTEHRGTVGELRKLIVHQGDADLIAAGPITNTMSIGGGLSYVCVLIRSSERRKCGFARTDVGPIEVGKIGFIRQSLGASWCDVPAKFAHTEYVAWLITEPEARALAAKGYPLKE